uniref:Uncharacterized protein n=1 Tax=viral metagenome TaxID=1070528 RepID=A0A2V0RJ43_9ZZZZ
MNSNVFKLTLGLRNLIRRISGYNTTIISDCEPNDKISGCSRSGRVDMQMPIVPGNPVVALAVAIAYLMAKASTPIVYVLSWSKTLIVAGSTMAVVRPGIPWRAVREVEKLLARIIGYRELTPIVDEQVAVAMGSYVLSKLLLITRNPVLLAAFLGGTAYFGITGLKNWIEYLIGILSRENFGDKDDSLPQLPGPNQLFISDRASLAEENRRLKLRIKQMERVRRFRGGNNEVEYFD